MFTIILVNIAAIIGVSMFLPILAMTSIFTNTCYSAMATATTTTIIITTTAAAAADATVATVNTSVDLRAQSSHSA